MQQRNPSGINRIVIAQCGAADQVGDCVAPFTEPITNPNVAFAVRKANLDTLADAPAIGVLLQKVSDTECSILVYGTCALYSGLVTGRVYHVGPSGAPALFPFPLTAPHYVQPIGVALGPDEMLVEPAALPTARRVP